MSNNGTTGVSPPDGSFFASSNKDVMKIESLVQRKIREQEPVLRTFSCRLNGHVNVDRNVDDGCKFCSSMKWDLMYGDEVTSYELKEDMDNPHVDMDASSSDGDDKEWVAKVMQEADDDQTHEPYSADYESPEMIFMKGESTVNNVEYQKATPSTVTLRKSRKKILVQGEDVTVKQTVEYLTPAEKQFIIKVKENDEWVEKSCTVTDTRILSDVYQSSDVETFEESEAKAWLPQNMWEYVMGGLESITVSEEISGCDKCGMPQTPRVIKMLHPIQYAVLKRNLRLVKMFTPESLEYESEIYENENGSEVITVITTHVYPKDEVVIGKAMLTNGYKAVETNCWNKAVRDTVRSVIIRIQKTDSESAVIAYYGTSEKHGSPLVSPKSMFHFYQNWKTSSIDNKVSLMESLIPSNIALPMLIPKSGDIVMMWNENISDHTQWGKDDICHNANVFVINNKTISGGAVPRQNFRFTLGKGEDARHYNRMSKSNGKTSSGQAFKYESHNLITMQELQSLSQGENVAWNDETMRTNIVYTKRFFKVPYTPMVFKKNRVTIVGTSKIANGSDLAHVKSIVTGILKEYSPADTVVISGGAVGIDRVAEAVAKELGIDTEIYMPEEHSYDYYLARDRAMANMSTRVVSIVNPLKSTKCYHCEKAGKSNNHEKSGGCYTGKYWNPMKYEVIIINSQDESKESTSSDKPSSASGSTSPKYDFMKMNEESDITPDNVDFNNIPENTTVVVGTNNMNWHGRGTARYAKDAGVIDTDKIYKFVTKEHPANTEPPKLVPVSLDVFKNNADIFIKYAKAHPERTIIMTAVGCGLAGFKPEQVKGFFKDVPSNVQLPKQFL